MTEVTLSIVSHGQIELAALLLQDLATNCEQICLKVILTLNLPEELPDSLTKLPYQLEVLRNNRPLGFGENHNKAFKYSKSNLFCVVNPDIRIDSNIFPTLIHGLKNYDAGIAAPLIVNGAGVTEDSARKFPTPFRILLKSIGWCSGHDYQIGNLPLEPDWIGGMFMLFRSDSYRKLSGFNQKFFLYYEDVDLCARAKLKGLRIILIPSVRATHLARRSSHRNIKYFIIHVRSMMRFFTSMVFLKLILVRW